MFSYVYEKIDFLGNTNLQHAGHDADRWSGKQYFQCFWQVFTNWRWSELFYPRPWSITIELERLWWWELIKLLKWWWSTIWMLRDGDGVLNFREFLLATHESVSRLHIHNQCCNWGKMSMERWWYTLLITVNISLKATGSAEQKLTWQFRLYDRDGSGCIDLREMIEILVMILQNDYTRQ